MAKEDLKQLQEENRVIAGALETPVMSAYEAGQREEAVRRSAAIPELEQQAAGLRAQLDALDFTWLNRLKEKIDLMRSERSILQKPVCRP